jgi:phosphohistidine phosphatase
VDLYLVRHAAAFQKDFDRWPHDSRRPLTPQGEEEFRLAARGLARMVPRADVILSSPARRAWHTAEILSELDSWPTRARAIAGARGQLSASLTAEGHARARGLR